MHFKKTFQSFKSHLYEGSVHVSAVHSSIGIKISLSAIYSIMCGGNISSTEALMVLHVDIELDNSKRYLLNNC